MRLYLLLFLSLIHHSSILSPTDANSVKSHVFPHEQKNKYYRNTLKGHSLRVRDGYNKRYLTMDSDLDDEDMTEDLDVQSIDQQGKVGSKVGRKQTQQGLPHKEKPFGGSTNGNNYLTDKASMGEDNYFDYEDVNSTWKNDIELQQQYEFEYNTTGITSPENATQQETVPLPENTSPPEDGSQPENASLFVDRSQPDNKQPSGDWKPPEHTSPPENTHPPEEEPIPLYTLAAGQLRFNKIRYSHHVNYSQCISLLPLTPKHYPIHGNVSKCVKESKCPSVIDSRDDPMLIHSVEELIYAVGGLPPHPSSDPEAPYWDKLREVMETQVKRREGVINAEQLFAPPATWGNFTLED